MKTSCFLLGGQVSFHVFPDSWNKRCFLGHVENHDYKTVSLFEDITMASRKDHEIFTDLRTTGHTKSVPEDSCKIIKEF